MTAIAAKPEPTLGAASPKAVLFAHSLRDDAIVIGPVLPEDTGSLFLWVNDADAAMLDLPFRPMDWMGYHNWLAELSRNAATVLFAIRRRAHPAIIGYIVLTKIHPVHRSAELGVRIGAEDQRGKGYGSAAIALALRYAWNQLNLNRVQLTVLSTNHRAIGAYQNAGFQHEGLSRQAAFIDGSWCDVVQMGILRPGPVLRDVSRPAPGA
jgi:RimJ/RimL family protein N-acetyltransferase